MLTNPFSCVRRTLLSAALIAAGVLCPASIPYSHDAQSSVAQAAAAAAQLRIRDLAGVKIVQQAVEFPSRANELNGKPVEVNGFMIPLGMGEGKLKKFVLIEVPLSCCFADGPGIDQMVFVSLAPGKELDYASDFPVTVTGRFQAGIQKNQYGQVESLYRIFGASAKKIGE